MKKDKKKQLLEITRLLHKAQEQIVFSLERENYETADAILEDCRQVAVSIAACIEKFEAADFVTIPFLEEYCELAGQMHQAIRDKEHINGKKDGCILEKQLIKIENSIRCDISGQKEVLFLPYKASMWDSLDGLWRAAVSDPECHALVIPIPYFDKQQDGSFGEMHYEGSQFPADVPIASYKDYDIALMRPDQIFIHNPYDEFNHVTSVHPFFYAKNLRKYTDELIYVPYFVLREMDPDDEKAVESIRHFVTVPGVLYADRVIVQSENMRRIYVDVMTQMTGTDTRKDWEKKIEGSGSPKFKRALWARSQNFAVPDSWKSVIQRKNGERKNIVLYNTSVNALLTHRDTYLEKLREVLEIFEVYSGEIALLWRPHPLMVPTIESMAPQLLEEYQEIVENYQAKGFGIYDDTADLDRAIGIADAYYGDHSSIVQLCRYVGIPIMIQYLG